MSDIVATNVGEPTGQRKTMEGLVMDLTALEALDAEEIASAERNTLLALENFAAAYAVLTGLEELNEKQRSEFDAMAFLGLSGSEAIHSKVLAWLLDPLGSHGAKDEFLRGFLLETTKEARLAGIETVALAEKSGFDWLETRVHREWHNIVEGYEGYLDILLLNQKEGFVCAVENKVFSGEHGQQLTRYRKALAADFPDDFARHHVFLSPRGTVPCQDEDRQYWTPVNYGMVLRLVEHTIVNSSHPVREDVRIFLEQYATTLRRRIVADADTNVREMARSIYLKHRKAIDLMIHHRPDFRSEMKTPFQGGNSRANRIG